MARTEIDTVGAVGVKYRIYFSHDEVEDVCNSATPVAAFIALVASVVDYGIVGSIATFVTSGIVSILKNEDKKHGYNGLCVTFLGKQPSWIDILIPGRREVNLAVSAATFRIKGPNF